MVDSEDYFNNQSDYEKKYDGGTKIDGGATINVKQEIYTGWHSDTEEYQIPAVKYSPEDIFKGDVAGLDINFINPENKDGAAGILQGTISRWYYTLRNVALLGLMVVLVYVGIRIVTSSSVTDKSKYKQLFMDWFIAICLIFVLHYIMAFTITMTKEISSAIRGEGSYIEINLDTTDDDVADKSFKTNLLGQARFKTQYKDGWNRLAYLAIYIFLVYYTVYFTFTYLKRVIMMAFLTVISPLVALTYPIDKMNDGQAQAFNSWLKEYVYNSLIQPFHLVLYLVFVGSAIDLAQENMLYAIAAMWFITKAEGILRSLFGFSKAPSLGNTMAGFAGGMVASKAMGMLKNGAGSSKKAKGQGESGDKPIRFDKKHDVKDIFSQNGEKTDRGKDKEIPGNGDEEIPGKGDEIPGKGDGIPGKGDGIPGKGDEVPGKGKHHTNSNPVNNWVNAHGGKRNVAKKAIKGVSKGFSKVAFTGAGVLGGAIAGGITGKGIGGMLTGAVAGGKLGNVVGGKVADVGINATGSVFRGGKRVYDAAKNPGKGHLLGGTALGRGLDTALGNDKYEKAGKAREFKKDPDNVQYMREKITADNGGVAPSRREVERAMNSLDPYIEQELGDIKEMVKAQRAEAYTNPQQAAIIAAIGKERGITADILNDDKKSKAAQANLQQEFMSKGYNKATAAQQADYTMNILKVQNGVAHNLKKK